jgi:V/A-type H+-transporting ATPase subunit D
MKRDGLIIEFFELLPKVKDMRSQLVELYTVADKKLAVAMVADGKSALRSAANCVRTPPQVELSEYNIMGVVVPKIKVSTIQKSVEERGYGLIGTSVRIDESVHAFEKLAEKVLEAAELETTMKKLLDAIESTKRRVNALEFKIIPQLEEVAAYITLRLEELERENIFRLKRIKA